VPDERGNAPTDARRVGTRTGDGDGGDAADPFANDSADGDGTTTARRGGCGE
jgi:hypothetical protein